MPTMTSLIVAELIVLDSAARVLPARSAGQQCKENTLAALPRDPDKVIARIGGGVLAPKNGDLADAAAEYAQAVSSQSGDAGCLRLAQRC
jgi:hypothetical protein